MRNALVALICLAGLSPAAALAQVTTTVDPSTILFSIPSISNEIGALEPVPDVSDDDTFLHEDDWRQVEFYPRARLEEVRGVLRELSAFTKQHRKAVGFDRIYIRKLAPAPMLAGADALRKLSEGLGVAVEAGPVLFYSEDAITGRIANGFSLNVSKELLLYGVEGQRGIEVLGAAVDGGDAQLVDVFVKLNASDGLILVDWLTQMLVVGADTDGQLEIWRP